jgi:hypothetical protein
MFVLLISSLLVPIVLIQTLRLIYLLNSKFAEHDAFKIEGKCAIRKSRLFWPKMWHRVRILRQDSEIVLLPCWLQAYCVDIFSFVGQRNKSIYLINSYKAGSLEPYWFVLLKRLHTEQQPQCAFSHLPNL